MAVPYFTPPQLERIEAESFVTRIDYHPELPSTNDLALELIGQAAIAAPCLVLTERQTAGRGRGANRWWAADGALTFSVIINAAEIQLPTERRPRLSLATGLSVCQALAEVYPEGDFGLKWPNDVFLGRQKIGGILVEVPPQQSDHLVVGIGINANNSFQDAPQELKPLATSLRDVTAEHYDLADILIRVLARVAASFSLLAAEDAALSEAWQSHCILRGRTVHLQTGPRLSIGVCHGIDDDGALILDTGTEIERLYGGVVAHYE